MNTCSYGSWAFSCMVMQLCSVCVYAYECFRTLDILANIKWHGTLKTHSMDVLRNIRYDTVIIYFLLESPIHQTKCFFFQKHCMRWFAAISPPPPSEAHENRSISVLQNVISREDNSLIQEQDSVRGKIVITRSFTDAGMDMVREPSVTGHGSRRIGRQFPPKLNYKWRRKIIASENRS